MSTPPGGPTSTSNYFCHNCGTINTNETICIQCQSEFLEEMPVQTHQFDIQSFTNMLLLMLTSQMQSDLPQQRHRRSRTPRRIKRVTHPHRYLPFLDLSSFQPNITLVQAPLQLVVFDQNGEMLTQLLNENMAATRDDINQLPSLTMTPSNLSVNPVCPICLENFDSLSEVKQLPTCHHVFHTNCLTEWLLRHGNCPMCRTNILSIQRTSFPIFNDHWMQQFFFGQQPQILDHPATDDTPQLPRFDSQTHHDSSSNTE